MTADLQLGACSIYSMFILGRTVSWRTAASLFGAVMLLGSLPASEPDFCNIVFDCVAGLASPGTNLESNCLANPSDMF